MIYIIFFAISLLLIEAGKRRLKHGYDRSAKFYFFAALLVPAILAGLRDFKVGTDVLVYGNTWFSSAVHSKSIFSYIQWAAASDIGVAYAAINYIVSIFTNNVHWFYFVLSFLTTGFAFLTVYDYRDKVDITFSMFVYYMMFYNMSLNLLRQSIAITILFFGFRYMRRLQPIRYLIVLLVAVSFHSSAAVGALIFVMYYLFQKKLGRFWGIAIVAGSLFLLVFSGQLLSLTIDLGIISNRYSTYVDGSALGGRYVRLLLETIPLSALALWRWKGLWKEDKDNRFFLVSVLISLILSILNFQVAYAIRIAYFIDIFYLFLIPVLADNIRIKFVTSRSKHIQRNDTYALFAIYLLVYWVFINVVRGSGETYPYIFANIFQ